MTVRVKTLTVEIFSRFWRFVYNHRIKLGWGLIIGAIGIRFVTELLPVLHYSFFYGDQAIDALKLAGIRQGEWPTLGPPNSFAGYDLPPTYYYLIVPFLVFGLHPALHGLPNAILSLLAIPLLVLIIYRLARRRWSDHGQSLAFAGLIALWTSINWFWYSTSVGSWCPFPIPTFILLIVLIMDKIIEDNRPNRKGEGKYWLAIGALIGLSLGFHSITLILMPVYFLGFAAYALYRSPRRLPWFLAACALILLILAPYFIGESTRGFTNTRTLVHSLQNASTDYNPVSRLNRAVGYIHASVDSVYVVSDSYREATIIILVLCFLGTLALIRLLPRLGVLLTTLVTLNIISASGYAGSFYPHYYLLAGVVCSLSLPALIIDPPRRGRPLLLALIMVILIASSIKGVFNITYNLRSHYGATRLLSVNDRKEALSLIPPDATLCVAGSGIHLDYQYIRDQLLHRTDLGFRPECQSGDYYIDRHYAIDPEPISISRADFTVYRSLQAYDILLRK